MDGERLRHGLKTVAAVLLVCLAATCFIPALAMAQDMTYYRLVVLADPHLPLYLPPGQEGDRDKGDKIYAAKCRVREDINCWEDVGKVVVLGDVVANLGTEEEYAAARQYFAQFNKPLAFVTGNHDYIYEDVLSPQGKRLRADSGGRQRKLNLFRSSFGQGQLYYHQEVGRYLLVFLSVDSLDSSRLAALSPQQLEWFKQELRDNVTRPTIVFFHAPLAGTLTDYNSKANQPDFIAQPQTEIEDILNANPQVFLWVSGHTHTPATNPDFASEVNRFAERVTNIHNADLNRQTIWTNSLYLYEDKVVIKTYNHRTGEFMDARERTIALPELLEEK